MSSGGAGAACNVAVLLRNRASTDRERKLVSELLRAADANRDGVVDYEECAALFRKKGLHGLSARQVREIFEAADKNGDR